MRRNNFEQPPRRPTSGWSRRSAGWYVVLSRSRPTIPRPAADLLSPPATAAPAGPAGHRSYAGLISRLTALALDVVLLCAATIGVRLLPGTAWTQIVNRSSPGWLEAAAVTTASLL